ncbi:MAG TPA: hypothetical protein VGO45_02170 [Bacteroidia bacterium]|jgi:hypothetical protein|nr:hypothetical protein [Bacteroidia bacterium]
MKKLLKILAILCFLSLPAITSAQGVALNANEKPDTRAPGASREQRRAARKHWRDDRRKKHAQDKALKDYQKHSQTKATRRRMKENRAKAEMNNQHKREFFLKRWFHRRRVKKTKKQDR